MFNVFFAPVLHPLQQLPQPLHAGWLNPCFVSSVFSFSKFTNLKPKKHSFEICKVTQTAELYRNYSKKYH